MQAEQSPPSETNSDRSSKLIEISSDDSSYGEKVSSQPIRNQKNHVLPSNTNAFIDLSTTNFHFEIEESVLAQPKAPEKPSTAPRQPQSKDSPSSNSTNPIDQVDDELDLKDLLKLLGDAKQYEQLTSSKDYESPRKNTNSRPLKQVKVQNPSQKIKQPKTLDNFKKPKNDFPQPHQLDSLQRFDFHHLNLLPPKHMPFQPIMYYPPIWNQWQQYQNIEPFQKPYFEKPIKSYQAPMTKKSHQEEFASQNFVFRNVLISIKLCSFLSLKKKVLLAPFSSSNLDDKISRVITKRLKYNIREILYVQASKTNQKEVQDGYVFSVKAKGLEKNYRGIYFIKSPIFHSQEMKYYSVGMLQSSVKRIFELVHEHMEEEIVFPDFDWGSLNQNELCQNLIQSVFREINEQKKNYRCMSLKEVIISVNNCQNFELYSKYLKSYVQQLRN